MLILGVDGEEREVGNGADDEQQWHGKGAVCYKQKMFEKAKGKGWAHLKACQTKRSVVFFRVTGGVAMRLFPQDTAIHHHHR